MIRVPVSNGKAFTIIDDDDAALVEGKKLYLASQLGYAAFKICRDGVRSSQYLHRVLLDPPKGMQVDHINGDVLDNRRCNLRLCTHAENMRNSRRKKSNKVGLKGVRKEEGRGGIVFIATLPGGGESRHATAEDAARAYDLGASRQFGRFARLNFPGVPLVKKEQFGRARTSSGYRGVHKHSRAPGYQVLVRGRNVGYFLDPVEAARAYDAKAREVFGDRAKLNFPQEQPALSA